MVQYCLVQDRRTVDYSIQTTTTHTSRLSQWQCGGKKPSYFVCLMALALAVGSTACALQCVQPFLPPVQPLNAANAANAALPARSALKAFSVQPLKLSPFSP